MLRKDAQYDWEDLIRKIRKIRGSYDRTLKSRHQPRPLVIKKKEFLDNEKTIARGLMRWECVRRNAQLRRLYKKDNSVLCLGEDIWLTPETTKGERSFFASLTSSRLHSYF